MNLLNKHNRILDERAIRTYDTKVLEGKLGLGNEKFDPNGIARPFYGLTCIAWLDQKSELFQKLCELQIEFRERFQAAGLGNIFTFLEPKSFHMKPTTE